MYSHAPEGYVCPFCLLAQGIVNRHVLSRQTDIVYRDDEVMAVISAHQWPNNPGHVLVIPIDHHENIYDLPIELSARVHELARALALAFKSAYRCDGVSTRQHNEPAGNQDVWHYHLHVFPRYVGDDLYRLSSALMPVGERARYADRLHAELAHWTPATRQ